jgi:hypothetical protein
MPSPRRMPRRALRAALVPVATVLVLGAPLAGAVPAAAAREVGAASAPQRAADAYRYAFRIETGDDDPVRGVTYVSTGRSRIELVDEHGARSSSYLLVSDNGRVLTAVDPAKREYSTTDAANFERVVGTAMEAVDRVMTLEVHDLDVTGRRLGAGGRVAGHETQRARLSTSYALRIGAMGFAARRQHAVDVDYWIAPALQLPRNPMLELFASLPTVLAQGDRDFVTRLRAGRDALVGTGTPLKVVVTARERDEDGDDETSRTVIEITDLTPGAQDQTLFQVPAGYRKRDGFNFSVSKP